MKIAFTFNLRVNNSEEQAEFDSEETITRITEALESFGHEVEKVELSRPLPEIVSHLVDIAPDLIFNVAEGKSGRFREAFWPAVFDELKIPFTGSDAYSLGLTLNKDLTKKVVSEFGIKVPKGRFVQSAEGFDAGDFNFPLFIKPNFEGSSKGISESNIVDSADKLQSRLDQMLKNYPEGVIVEEYIEGSDVTVPFLEAAGDNPVLDPIVYCFDEETTANRRFNIYDYELKNDLADTVGVAAADIDDDMKKKIEAATLKVLKAVNCRDFGRLDFRITPDGRLYFLEINCLASLEKGAGIFLAAEKRGISEVGLINAIVESAVQRYGIRDRKARGISRKHDKLRVAFLYNIRHKYPDPSDIDTHMEVDFDDPETNRVMTTHLEACGFEVVPIEADENAYFKLYKNRKNIDIVFNYAEGLHGQDREAHIPAMLEMLGIPYTGSSPLTQCLVLNKAKTKQILKENGISVTPSQVFETGEDELNPDLAFPLFVKPACHGSSAGINNDSIVENEKDLYRQVRFVIDSFRQPALVEPYLEGREFSVPMLGNPPRVLPIIEADFSLLPDQYKPIDSFEVKWIHEVAVVDKNESGAEFHLKCPAEIDDNLKAEIEDMCIKAWHALGIRDFCRIDIRCDKRGNPYILEVNSPPGMIPPEVSKASYLPLAARAIGMDYQDLLKNIIYSALKRYENKTCNKIRDLSRS